MLQFMRQYADIPAGDDERLSQARDGMKRLRRARAALAMGQLQDMLTAVYVREDGAETPANVILRDWLAWSDGIARSSAPGRAGFRRVWLYRQLAALGIPVEHSRTWGTFVQGIKRAPGALARPAVI